MFILKFLFFVFNFLNSLVKIFSFCIPTERVSITGSFTFNTIDFVLSVALLEFSICQEESAFRSYLFRFFSPRCARGVVKHHPRGLMTSKRVTAIRQCNDSLRAESIAIDMYDWTVSLWEFRYGKSSEAISNAVIFRKIQSLLNGYVPEKFWGLYFFLLLYKKFFNKLISRTKCESRNCTKFNLVL